MNDSQPNRPHVDQREEIARRANEIKIKLLAKIERAIDEDRTPGYIEAYETLCRAEAAGRV
jgi:hypothetical protein